MSMAVFVWSDSEPIFRLSHIFTCAMRAPIVPWCALLVMICLQQTLHHSAAILERNSYKGWLFRSLIFCKDELRIRAQTLLQQPLFEVKTFVSWTLGDLLYLYQLYYLALAGCTDTYDAIVIVIITITFQLDCFSLKVSVGVWLCHPWTFDSSG